MNKAQKISLVVTGIGIVLVGIACVGASPSPSDTPLYTVRMEQVSSAMHFLPTAVNGFVYNTESGYTLDHGLNYITVTPATPTYIGPTCDYTCAYTCEGHTHFGLTCWYTCGNFTYLVHTCEMSCGLWTCDGGATCSTCVQTCLPTCQYTCPATCLNTCNGYTCDDTSCQNTCYTCDQPTCPATCWDTCEGQTCWDTCGSTCFETCEKPCVP